MKEMLKANIGFKRWFFFAVGIIATLGYRSMVVLKGNWVQIAWYTGTIGFILYFAHRTYVQKKRAELVKENHLVRIVDKQLKRVTKKQRAALHYIVYSSATSKVRWNSLFIFWLSVLALVVGILVDFVF